MSVNKGNRRLLRRLGNSLDTNLIVDGNLESGNYGVEYDTIMKARRKATFENNKFKDVELLNRGGGTVLEPFFYDMDSAFIEFNFNDDYASTNGNIIIEFDYKFYNLFLLYPKFFFQPFQNNNVRAETKTETGSESNYTLQSLLVNFNATSFNLDINQNFEWDKFRLEIDIKEGGVNKLLIRGQEYTSDSTTTPPTWSAYGINFTKLFFGKNDDVINYRHFHGWMKNIKFSVGDNVIIDCPDPVTGINNGSGSNGIPNNIIYK